MCGHLFSCYCSCMCMHYLVVLMPFQQTSISLYRLSQQVITRGNSLQPAENQQTSSCYRLTRACNILLKRAQILPSASSQITWTHEVFAAQTLVCVLVVHPCGCKSNMTGQGLTEWQHHCRSCRCCRPWWADVTLRPLCLLHGAFFTMSMRGLMNDS